MVDARSEKNIETLEPAVRPLARKLVETCVEQGIPIKIIDGSRTYAQQNALYAQGRTKPGRVVTKAKGGQSWHNFGLAFDIGVFSVDGKAYIPESPLYKQAGVIGESIGLEWGGRWKFVDEPHFQYNPQGYTIADMRERKDKGLPLT